MWIKKLFSKNKKTNPVCKFFMDVGDAGIISSDICFMAVQLKIVSTFTIIVKCK